jgi:hypothetical protein
MSGLRYVYAVTAAPAPELPDRLRGVAEASVETVTGGGLAAVVSKAPESDFAEEALRRRLEDLDWLSDTARAHDAVVGAVADLATAVPLRLATVCRGEEGVRRLLEQDGARLERTLRRLTGRVEWGVKVYAEPAPPETAAPAEPGPGSGRAYLRRRLRERDAGDRSRDAVGAFCRGLHRRLSARAEATRLHRPQQARLSGTAGENVLNAAYLVRDEDGDAFTGLVEGLPREPGVRVLVTGPWAPYSFAGEDDEEAPRGTAEGKPAPEGRSGTDGGESHADAGGDGNGGDSAPEAGRSGGDSPTDDGRARTSRSGPGTDRAEAAE